MLHAGKNYVYGTAAEKIQYDVYEENTVLKQKKKYKSNRGTKLKAVLLIIAAFVMCYFVILRYTVITELNYKIIKESKNYENVRNEYVQLKVDIDKSLDLQKIREIAEKKLGMQKPDRFQMVYVNVPKSDFTKVASVPKNDGMTNIWVFAIILDRVERFTSLIY